jgi:hypothetical protein
MFLPDPDLQDFVRAHRHLDPAQLALQARKYPQWPMAWVAEQAHGWQVARQKLPTWAAADGLLYPPRLAMEQCSSEATAIWKAGQFSGRACLDLTGGWGVDAWAFSRRFDAVVYVERQEELAATAAHNFRLLGAGNIEARSGDALALLPSLPAADLIYLDPARRDAQQRKVAGLEDCEPDLAACFPQLLAHAPQVLAKASPMLDLKLAAGQLGGALQEIWVVAVGNECKEVLLLLGREPCASPRIKAVQLLPNGSEQVLEGSWEEEASAAIPVGAPQAYLYEPHAALMKAGLFKSIGRHWPVQKLHAHSHLYTSAQPIEGFHGRTFAIADIFPYHKKQLRKVLPAQANLAVRNFPLTVAQLRQELGLREGGSDYLFATTLADGQRVLLRARRWP